MTNQSIELVVEVQKDGLSKDLDTLLSRLDSQNLQQWMETDVQSILQARADARFAAEGDDAVGSWMPLQPYTQSIRAAMGYGPTGPINVRTGEMKDFVTRGTPDSVATGDGAELYFPDRKMPPSVAKKIGTAQLGAIVPSTVPRPVVAVSAVDEKLVQQSLIDYMSQGMFARII